MSAIAPCTILVAEDETSLRELITDILLDEGYQVVGVPDAARALAVLASDVYSVDLLLSDIQMPGVLNGIQLAQRVRSEHPAIQVLLMSGNPPEGLAKAQLPFLHKPFGFADLLVAVKACLLQNGEGCEDAATVPA